MRFRDRLDAGRQLAARLDHLTDAVVLALPRGGVPVAAPIAEALGAPLDLVLVRKLGLPRQPELAMGAVVDGAEPIVVRNEEVIRAARVPEAEFERVRAAEMTELRRRARAYLGGRVRAAPKGRTAILVDDGIATGATMRAALRGVRRQGPAHLVLAVPVAAADSLAGLAREADEIVCLATPEPFVAIGAFYEDFGQTGDEEVRALLARHPPGPGGPGSAA